MVGTPSVGRAIRAKGTPAVVCLFANNAVDVSREASMKRDVVDSGESPVMRAAGKDRRSGGHKVDVTTPPGNPVVSLLIDRPSERLEQPAPGPSRAVEVSDPNLNVVNPKCHVAIVPWRSRSCLNGNDHRDASSFRKPIGYRTQSRLPSSLTPPLPARPFSVDLRPVTFARTAGAATVATLRRLLCNNWTCDGRVEEPPPTLQFMRRLQERP